MKLGPAEGWDLPGEWPIERRFLPALLGRLFLVVYARLHDYLFHVRFTDIDYLVFTDAARHVLNGDSPFKRATYRYSPALAWLLTPNVFAFQDFGGFFLMKSGNYMHFQRLD